MTWKGAKVPKLTSAMHFSDRAPRHQAARLDRTFNGELAAVESQGGAANGKPASGYSLAALHDSYAKRMRR